MVQTSPRTSRSRTRFADYMRRIRQAKHEHWQSGTRDHMSFNFTFELFENPIVSLAIKFHPFFSLPHITQSKPTVR